MRKSKSSDAPTWRRVDLILTLPAPLVQIAKRAYPQLVVINLMKNHVKKVSNSTLQNSMKNKAEEFCSSRAMRTLMKWSL